jgi:hypothetical protein
MALAPRLELVYPTDGPDTLAELRRYVELYPGAAALEAAELARRLGCPEAEVEAACQCLIDDQLEIRA